MSREIEDIDPLPLALKHESIKVLQTIAGDLDLAPGSRLEQMHKERLQLIDRQMLWQQTKNVAACRTDSA